MGVALLFVFHAIISLLILAIIVYAVLSWLIAFDVINMRNAGVARIVRALSGVVEPMLAPLQRLLPNLGGLDLSPIIALILLQALEIVVDRTVAPALIGLLG